MTSCNSDCSYNLHLVIFSFLSRRGQERLWQSRMKTADSEAGLDWQNIYPSTGESQWCRYKLWLWVGPNEALRVRRSLQFVFVLYSVCDDTQNLNETESETCFRYQIFPIPNSILFSIPTFFDTESDTFFRYQILSIPKLKPSKKWKRFETETSHSGWWWWWWW